MVMGLLLWPTRIPFRRVKFSGQEFSGQEFSGADRALRSSILKGMSRNSP